MSVADLLWPFDRLGEGVEELARRARLRPAPGDPIETPVSVLEGGAEELSHWFDWVGERLGVDVDAVEVDVPSVDALLRGAAPVIIRVATPQGPGFLFILRAKRGRARLVAPDLSLRSASLEELRQAICSVWEQPLFASIEGLLDAANVAPSRRPRLRAMMMRERLLGERARGFWILRLPPTAEFARQLAWEKAPRRLVGMLGLFAAVYAIEIVAWGLIGDAALNGHIDFGWLTAWVLLIVSAVPMRLAGTWIDSMLAIDAGALLKLRLLLGALRADVEQVKRHGVGQMLGRVMESQALESLAVNGGLSALIAVMELFFAAWILVQGAGGWMHLGLLAGWLGFTFALGWRYYRRLSQWTGMRVDMTHHLVEQMVGHRTRLAQEWAGQRDATEDRMVKDYLNASASMDQAILPFLAGVPGGWMLVGLAGLVPSFVAGVNSPVAFAIGLGGVLLAARALSGVAGGIAAAARASIAWEVAAPLFHAGAKPVSNRPYVPRQRTNDRGRTRLLEADTLTFRYQSGREAVLDKATLSIARGDRVLLEGASGSGKSTLASALVGLRRPESGLLLLNGLDRNTLGEEWHRIATEAPQFNENHIFTATLGFNLLMGRRWPASDSDLKMAERLCVELGLGDLLARMPSGMMQTVGETGWQLSHGERSRIFLARALLQDADLTIFDESFAALDPETLKGCLECVFRRARSLVVVAHP